jgi:hypothetical protein
VLLGTEIATIVAAAGWVMRASPPATPAAAGMQSALTLSPRRFRTCAGEVIGFMSNNHIDPELTIEVLVFEPLPSPNAH